MRKTKIILILAVLLATAFTGALPAQNWQELGPAPIINRQATGRASTIVPSPSRRGYYLVAGASGGVWRSTNAGGTWLPLTDQLPITAIGALAIDPRNERLIYAGSGEGNYAYHSLYGLGLYRSTNAGASWQVLAPQTFAGRTFSRLVVAPVDGTVWAAVTIAGGTFAGREGARRHPARNGVVGVFRSRNRGDSWGLVRNGLPPTPATDIDIDPRNPQRIYATFGDPFGRPANGIYRSVNGGRSFSKLSGLADGTVLGRIALAISPSNPDRLYALVANVASRAATGGFFPPGASTFGLYRSNNGGNTWTFTNPGNFMGQQGDYDIAVVVDPNHPDVVYLGGVQMLRSTDGGATFQNVTPPHVDLHDLAFDAARRLVAATDGGVHRTTDRGNTWTSQNRTLGLNQLYAGLSLHPTNRELILAGTQDNGTNLRLGGKEWVQIFGGDGGQTVIVPEQPNIVFVQFQGVANLFRSNDGGASFQLSSTGISANDRTAFQAPLVLDPNNSNRLLYATQRIWQSNDQGLSWTAISGDLTGGGSAAIRSLVIAPSDSNVVYAVTNEGRVLVSEDGGSSFVLRRQGIAGWPRIMRQIAVDPGNAAAAWVADAAFGGPRLLATDDRGATWQEVGQALPNTPINTVAVFRDGPRRGLLAGTDRGVYVSFNNGGSWRLYGNGLPKAPVQDLVADVPRRRVVAATLGRGVWSVVLPTPAAGGG